MPSRFMRWFSLVPNRDAILICRSMIEGLCQVAWAAQQPTDRPLDWRSFAWIRDWRLMRDSLANGHAVDPERQAMIATALQGYGQRFFTEKAKRALGQTGALPDDPYHKNWRRGQTIKDICAAVNATELYDKLYAPYSDWHHWNVAGFAEVIHRDGPQVRYASLTPRVAAEVVAVAFQCLIETLQYFDRAFGSRHGPAISEIRDEYLALHDEPLNVSRGR